ncbi:MAG: c-type cytochrome domain-containing protein [Verrucomicrobiales bacterium]
MAVSRIIHGFVAGLTSWAAGMAGAAVDFDRDIRLVLEASCVQCHGADKDKGGLRLHTAESLTAGGESGAVIDAANPDGSLLLQRVLLPEDDDDAMPPKGKAPRPTAEQVAKLREWMAAGAAWPEGVTLKPADPEAQVSPRDGENLVSIQIFPPSCSLETKRDEQRLVVMATYGDDTTRDVTKKVSFAVADPALVRHDGNRFMPVANGQSTIRVEFFGKSAEVPLKVSAATEDRPISFRLDVMPVLERGGCNTGSCHGSARGQDGFHLSLFRDQRTRRCGQAA